MKILTPDKKNLGKERLSTNGIDHRIMENSLLKTNLRLKKSSVVSDVRSLLV
jgi:hypothetical protein